MDILNKKRIYTNYKRENKWLGIIEYKSLLIIVVYSFFVIKMLGIIKLSFELSMYIFIFACFPIVTLLCVKINNESLVYTFRTIFQYVLTSKIYVDIKYEKYFKKEIYINYSSKIDKNIVKSNYK